MKTGGKINFWSGYRSHMQSEKLTLLKTALFSVLLCTNIKSQIVTYKLTWEEPKQNCALSPSFSPKNIRDKDLSSISVVFSRKCTFEGKSDVLSGPLFHK